LQIKIEQFNGPLDLLLQLIEQQKMDITQISIASVTEQFLNTIKGLAEIDPTSMADYLSVAAKLLVIKSKAILPTLELTKEEQEITQDLESRLILYRKFKDASNFLKGLDGKRQQGFSRAITFEEKINFYPDPTVTTETLYDKILGVLKSLEEINNLPKATVKKAISIQEKIEHLQVKLADRIETKLSDLISVAKDKTEVIVTFLALLELIKQRVLSVEQEYIFSEIIIKQNQEIQTNE
jgi:segregation and condensation protein A